MFLPDVEDNTGRKGAYADLIRQMQSAGQPFPQIWHLFAYKPEVTAALTNKVFYANANKESKKFIKPEVASNPTVFLSEENVAKMKGSSDLLNNEIRRQQNRVYTSFKTGL